MNAIHLLLGLLVLAYVGSILVGGRAIRGYGLPSGAEYVALGFVLGPHVLGMLDLSTIRSFEPVVQTGLCWLALMVGVDYGYVGDRRMSLKRLAVGVGITVLAAAIVGGAIFLVATRALRMPTDSSLLLAVALSAVSCETTRHAVRWVALKHAAQGPISDLVAEIADADDAVPLVMIAALFAITPAHDRAIAIPAWAGIAISIGLGLALGALVAALVRRELRPTEVWGLLIGSVLLGIGTLTRVGLAAISMTFFMGLSLIALSRHRLELRHALTQTEHAVLLPTLMLAGAHVTLAPTWQNLLLVGVAVFARLFAKLLSGLLLCSWKPARPAGALLGLGLMPSGALTMSIGLVCAFRLPSAVGTLVLAAAAANVLFGEMIGPGSLKRALMRVGEIEEPQPAPVAAASEAETSSSEAVP